MKVHLDSADVVLYCTDGLCCKFWQPLIASWSRIKGKNYWTFFFIAAAAILWKNGLVIGLYQRVILCQSYHLEINVSVFIQPCQECWLIGPLTAVAQKWLLWLFFHCHVVKVGNGLIIISTHYSA